MSDINYVVVAKKNKLILNQFSTESECINYINTLVDRLGVKCDLIEYHCLSEFSLYNFLNN